MKTTITLIDQPNHWTDGKYRVHTHDQGTGSWRYFDTLAEAEASIEDADPVNALLANEREYTHDNLITDMAIINNHLAKASASIHEAARLLGVKI